MQTEGAQWSSALYSHPYGYFLSQLQSILGLVSRCYLLVSSFLKCKVNGGNICNSWGRDSKKTRLQGPSAQREKIHLRCCASRERNLWNMLRVGSGGLCLHKSNTASIQEWPSTGQPSGPHIGQEAARALEVGLGPASNLMGKLHRAPPQAPTWSCHIFCLFPLGLRFSGGWDSPVCSLWPWPANHTLWFVRCLGSHTLLA